MKNIHVERYEVILKNPDGALVSLKLVPASEQVPQTTFEGLQEKTKYQLSVKQETKFRTIGHTSTENFTTTKCMYFCVTC